MVELLIINFVFFLVSVGYWIQAIGYKEEITWKRPCQFLPVIVDLPVVPAAPPPPVPEPKAAGKKGAAPAAKKGEPEPRRNPLRPSTHT